MIKEFKTILKNLPSFSKKVLEKTAERMQEIDKEVKEEKNKNK